MDDATTEWIAKAEENLTAAELCLEYVRYHRPN
jgi:uncharacterized protein (UPF0332 family)